MIENWQIINSLFYLICAVYRFKDILFDCRLVVVMVTLQEAYILKSSLFINLFLKPCFVWKNCMLMCTYSHKLEEMA